MKSLFSTDSRNGALTDVLDVSRYDKIKLQKKDGYIYYKYQGSTVTISSSRDLRKGMVFGIKEFGIMSFIHIPQYQKIIKCKARAITEAVKKSVKFVQSHYEEV